MALESCKTIALEGVIAHIVDIEANIGAGLPGIHVVGRTDTAISESRQRIKTAIINSKLAWPKTKIVVSLSPASLPKSGSHFDLPLAVAILLAGMKAQDEQLAADGYATWGNESFAEKTATTLFLGELGLDGSIRPVPGILSAMVAAQKHGYHTLVIPPGNAGEAQLVEDTRVLVAHNLREVFEWLRGNRNLTTPEQIPSAPRNQVLDFADIAGQHEAKFAAEVAAAGGHHLMMIGPPGSGKSMLAARIPSILPELTTSQSIESTAIHSIAGSLGNVITHAPFISPHASMSRPALLGGGSGNPRPGAVSLAHNGVLFLDEASEISPAVLDGLRAPLEDGEVRLARARREITYPARFQLVMAANPCRCAAEDPSKCVCRSTVRQDYLRNISGPLRDRLDIVLELSSQAAIIHTEDEESSQSIADRVAAARDRAACRWKSHGLSVIHNAAMSSTYLRRHCAADESAMALVGAFLAEGQLSQRGVDRCLKLAWTLSDLDGEDLPGLDHIARALNLRGEGF